MTGKRLPPWTRQNRAKVKKFGSRSVIKPGVLPSLNIKASQELMHQTTVESNWLARQVKEDPRNETLWRIMARVLGSTMETTWWSMKVQTLRMNDLMAIEFSNRELAILKERRFKPKTNNWVRAVYSQKSNAKTAISCFARVLDVPNPLGTTPRLPEFFGYWCELRNGITHPRTMHEYQINAKDIAVLPQVMTWLSETSAWAGEAMMGFSKKLKEGEIQFERDDLEQFLKTCLSGLVREPLHLVFWLNPEKLRESKCSSRFQRIRH